jgi:hypothetical protein
LQIVISYFIRDPAAQHCVRNTKRWTCGGSLKNGQRRPFLKGTGGLLSLNLGVV